MNMRVTNDEQPYFRGPQLTTEQAQSLIDSGQGHLVHESEYGFFYEKMFVNGSSKLNWDAAALSLEPSGSNAKNTMATEKMSHAIDLELVPEVKKLEEQAGQLETAADALKAEHDNAAVDDFEAAAGRVARAAEEVRENPTDESAIEELETATDELKNAAHALEGEIGDEQYGKIVTAVDGFETATDHLLAADDGEADMAGAISKATNALESLVEATTGMPNVKEDVKASDPYKELNNLSEKLNALVGDLMEKIGKDELADFEAAVEQLEEAIDTFNADPTSEASIEGLEKAADALKQATAGLEGKIDDSSYQDLTTAVTAFEEAVDKLAGLDGQQAEIDKVVPDIVQTLKDVIKAASGIEAEGDVKAVDPFKELDALSEELNALVGDLKAKYGVDELADFEAAVEQLEEAIDTFNADPTSEASIEGLEKAADAFKQATAGLEGKIDDSSYQDLTTAVNAFEEAVDKLAGLDGQQAEIDKVVPEIVQTLKDVNKAISSVIEGGSSIDEIDPTAIKSAGAIFNIDDNPSVKDNDGDGKISEGDVVSGTLFSESGTKNVSYTVSQDNADHINGALGPDLDLHRGLQEQLDQVVNSDLDNPQSAVGVLDADNSGDLSEGDVVYSRSALATTGGDPIGGSPTYHRLTADDIKQINDVNS